MTTWEIIPNTAVTIGDLVLLELCDSEQIVSGVVKHIRFENRRSWKHWLGLSPRTWIILDIGGADEYDALLSHNIWRVNYGA